MNLMNMVWLIGLSASGASNKNYILRGEVVGSERTRIMLSHKPESVLWVGNKEGYKTMLQVYQRFNWFQKLMWKWCFGVKVEDCRKEK